MHADDKHDALEWAIKELRLNSMQGGFDQLDRNRIHVLEQLRDEAQREARK